MITLCVSVCPILPAQFLEKAIFRPLNCFCILAKSQWTIYMKVYFFHLNSVPLISGSSSLLITHSPYNCTGLIYTRDSSHFIFFIILAVLWPTPVHINFMINLFISCPWDSLTGHQLAVEDPCFRGRRSYLRMNRKTQWAEIPTMWEQQHSLGEETRQDYCGEQRTLYEMAVLGNRIPFPVSLVSEKGVSGLAEKDVMVWVPG